MLSVINLAALLLLLATFSSRADTYTDEQSWLNLNAFVRLDEKWSVYGEYQPRFFDYQRYSGAVLHRGALGRDLGSGFSAWVGSHS